MTEQEVARLLLVIAARYPSSKLLGQEEALTARAWHMTLADVPYAEAERALADWFKTEKWAPDPSELRSAVAARLLDLPTPEEAWALARGVIAAYYPGIPSRVEVAPAIRRAINAIGGVHNLKLSETPSKDRDAFIRAYTIERKREMEQAILDAPAIAEPRLKAIR